MLRRITKQVGRWRPGVLHDWPLSTWNQLARDVGMKVDDFSKPEEMSEALTVRNRQNTKIRPRAVSGSSRTGVS